MKEDPQERAERLRRKTAERETAILTDAGLSLRAAKRDLDSTLAALDAGANGGPGSPLDLSLAYIARARATLADATEKLRKVQAGRDTLAAVATLFNDPTRLP